MGNMRSRECTGLRGERISADRSTRNFLFSFGSGQKVGNNRAGKQLTWNLCGMGSSGHWVALPWALWCPRVPQTFCTGIKKRRRILAFGSGLLTVLLLYRNRITTTEPCFQLSEHDATLPRTEHNPRYVFTLGKSEFLKLPTAHGF